MLENGTTGSYNSCTFSLLRNLNTDFQSGWNSLHSHQHCTGLLYPHLLDSICGCLYSSW
jgi:hypothetical protein